LYKVDVSHCIGCGVCEEICPESAIKLTKAEVARIDPKKCVSCGACADICPQEAIEEIEDEDTDE